MSSLIGIVTYGNTRFTEMCIRSIHETVNNPYEIFVVVGKADDTETPELLRNLDIPYKKHDFNYGFPYSVNDIYDYAWKENSFDNLVMIGNDVVAYPYAIDSLIDVADSGEYDWVCAREYDVRSLVRDHPEASKYFDVGKNYSFFQFDERPWEIGMSVSKEIEIGKAGLSDVHNLALFRKGTFDKIGYIDVNFYPAYYEDNDYVRRAILKDVTSCTIMNSVYFHFWSRTIHQGPMGASHSGYFAENRGYYMRKWGGDFGRELFDFPFNGVDHYLGGELKVEPLVEIFDRDKEIPYINYWRGIQGASQAPINDRD